MGFPTGTWQDIRKSQPMDMERIDVFIWWPDESNGQWRGERLCNCWNNGGNIMHGQHGMVIRNLTHWMYPPDDPPEPGE